jgi:hypothetical protein
MGQIVWMNEKCVDMSTDKSLCALKDIKLSRRDESAIFDNKERFLPPTFKSA